MDFSKISPLLADGNNQNRNAANAGDGPKHIAWLAFINELGPALRTIVETHSGGGIYRVPADRFCVGLPEDSVLGRYQKLAGLPPEESGMVHYGASGDQAISQMPQRCRYIAFDKCLATADRLVAIAEERGRSGDLDSRPRAYSGNGDPATGLRSILSHAEKPLLAMVDPFTLKDLKKASRGLTQVEGIRSILFGVTNRHRGTDDSELGWCQIARSYSGLHQIAWRWTGNGRPGEVSQHLFFLLISTPSEEECVALIHRLLTEHAILIASRSATHQYQSDGPKLVI